MCKIKNVNKIDLNKRIEESLKILRNDETDFIRYTK